MSKHIQMSFFSDLFHHSWEASHKATIKTRHNKTNTMDLPSQHNARREPRETPTRAGLPSAGLDRLRVEVGLGLGAVDAVNAGRAAGGLVDAGAAVLGAAGGGGAQLDDGGRATIRTSGLALGQSTVGAAFGSTAEADDRDGWEATETGEGRVGALHRLGVRVGWGAAAKRSVQALGVAGGSAEVEAAVADLAAGARLLLDDGGRTTEGSDGLTLGDGAVWRAWRFGNYRHEQVQLRPCLSAGRRHQNHERRTEHAETTNEEMSLGVLLEVYATGCSELSTFLGNPILPNTYQLPEMAYG